MDPGDRWMRLRTKILNRDAQKLKDAEITKQREETALNTNNPFTHVPDEVYVVGDWHSNTPWALHVLDTLPDWACIIQLGDFGIWGHREEYLYELNKEASNRRQEIVFIDGNHEDFPYLNEFELDSKGARPILSNITHLPRNFRWEWQGNKMLALGGAYSIDRNHRRLGRTYFEEETITSQESVDAINGGFADVMFTHDAPYGMDIPGLPDPKSWAPEHLSASIGHQMVLRAIVDEIQPRALFHGHMHSSYTGVIEGAHRQTVVRGLDCDGVRLDKHVATLTLLDLAL